MDAIKRAVEAAGGQTELARKIGVTQPQVYHWVSKLKPVPPKRCIPIEDAVGGAVTRYDLRPDVFGEPPGQPAA